MKINEILTKTDQNEVIRSLKAKTIQVPSWDVLETEYDVKKHPVFNKGLYPDVSNEDGTTDKVSRVGFAYQKLVTSRMNGLMFSVPVKRHYDIDVENETQQAIKDSMEKIFSAVRIDAENFERAELYNKSCEFATIWSTSESNNKLYGFQSPKKLKLRHVSPANKDLLFPVFDENDDMVAFCIEYIRRIDNKDTTFFDCYTSEKHLRWTKSGDGWGEPVVTPHTLGKIPVIYSYRQEPIWGDTSENVYEIEWLLSREGNYSRKNAKPLLVVKASEDVKYGNEKPGTTEFRTIFQVPEGGDIEYKTWSSAIESNKFLKDSIMEMNDKVLQIPDFSYENMKSKPLSGEAFKQMLIDAHLKVARESGAWLKFFDREINIVKAFLSVLQPAWKEEIENITVRPEITPFSVSEDKNLAEILDVLVRAGIISREAAAQIMNYVPDVQADMEKIKAEREEQAVEVEF
jgi:SPP1 family phage portal protein